jgi:hypothetical protein
LARQITEAVARRSAPDAEVTPVADQAAPDGAAPVE